jgi:L-asparaginase
VSEQVAQLDSKDMSFAVWQQLAVRVSHHLAQHDVKSVLITHGTDTLEETAFFLQAVLPAELMANKPVVLTCAMRPASSLSPDGPQNLLDAVAVAMTPGASGVVVMCAGVLHSAVEVQKGHTYRLDAFNSGDVGALGYVEEGLLRLVRSWPAVQANAGRLTLDQISSRLDWPRVEIVMNYAGGSAAVVDALLQQVQSQPHSAVQGLVVAATGNGTLHHELEAALRRAQTAGMRVVIASRCAGGRVMFKPGAAFADSQGLSPVKARIALMLALMAD